MTSIVVMTMTIIAIFTIPSDAASIRIYDGDSKMFFPVNYGICPTMLGADVDVVFNDSDSSTLKSCASFNYIPRDETHLLKSFRLKFNRLNNGALRSCAADDDTGIEMLVFPCLSPPALATVDSGHENLNVMLYGRVTKLIGKEEVRCAMYKMVDSTKYLMAVSSNESCDGLSLMLSNEQPDKINWWLSMDDSETNPSINQRRTRSTSDTKNSIKNFSGSRFFWRTG